MDKDYTIDTLIEDIYATLTRDKPVDRDVVLKECEAFGERMSKMLANRLLETRVPTVSMSQVGQPCVTKLWSSVNEPEKGEPLTGDTLFKFLYGDMVEELTLSLSVIAGHPVEGTQDRMTLGTVSGSRDAVIDGCTVDVKSASPYAFLKFKAGLTHDKDAFGYLTQLGLYTCAAKDDPLVTEKGVGYFLAVDKVSGKMHLDKHRMEDPEETEFSLLEMCADRQAVVASSERPSPSIHPVPDGKSGNMKLDTVCSYCAFKKECYPEVRTFLYSNGPRFLTRVVRTPDVFEVT